ncbi:50S ribosomal protein L29 [Candidatus Cryosericum odellii]|jgi:large subunit ribosomal protein L29|uniref:Large ribosomal subunit protein uL29 n=1 Tax=Candidatus Cryosericum odellii TaxID=2290917 RepID=A0A398D148_9BACT|nr:50S ribosomal protein L29 [Candidatus Cryosericum odellii]RIE08240.1 50S ribosomal protein L29 [Candidatus Cryosericum odellii]RIE11033.1 50S ribosomal protein L29 [Candidatus Cryosericum odellii]
MRINKVRDMSDAELKVNMENLRRELFNLRFQLATRQLKNTARVKEVRHDIAKILTVEHERTMGLALKKQEVK